MLLCSRLKIFVTVIRFQDYLSTRSWSSWEGYGPYMDRISQTRRNGFMVADPKKLLFVIKEYHDLRSLRCQFRDHRSHKPLPDEGPNDRRVI